MRGRLAVSVMEKHFMGSPRMEGEKMDPWFILNDESRHSERSWQAKQFQFVELHANIFYFYFTFI